MADNQKQIVQWFPGHMAKTRRLIKESLSLVDGVTEIIDARIPYSSSNPELEELINNKPRIVLLNKSDLADKATTNQCPHRLSYPARNLVGRSDRRCRKASPRTLRRRRIPQRAVREEDSGDRPHHRRRGRLRRHDQSPELSRCPAAGCGAR